jgi:hypothetical protein
MGDNKNRYRLSPVVRFYFWIDQPRSSVEQHYLLARSYPALCFEAAHRWEQSSAFGAEPEAHASHFTQASAYVGVIHGEGDTACLPESAQHERA